MGRLRGSQTPLAARRSITVTVAALALGSTAQCTGLPTCDSGPKTGWQASTKLERQLEDKGWTAHRIKEDGGSCELHGRDDKGGLRDRLPRAKAMRPSTRCTRRRAGRSGC